MNKYKLSSGVVATIIGYIALILIIDMLSKPSNVSLSLKPIESIETYFFGFVFSMGGVGWVLGSLLLVGFLALFYLIGVWLYKIVCYSKTKKR
jgi:hypothetical protein